MTTPLPLPAPEFAPGLQLLRSFEFYDRPLLFASEDTAGRIYLAVLASGEEGSETWLFAPITTLTLLDLTDGTIDYASAFKRPVAGKLYLVSTGPGEDESYLEVSVDALSEELMPEPGVYYTYGARTAI
jgi:hypothetical protein